MLDRPDFGDDDPFDELASSACNLLADSLGVRHCGLINADDAALRASSSEFWYLPDGVETPDRQQCLGSNSNGRV